MLSFVFNELLAASETTVQHNRNENENRSVYWNKWIYHVGCETSIIGCRSESSFNYEAHDLPNTLTGNKNDKLANHAVVSSQKINLTEVSSDFDFESFKLDLILFFIINHQHSDEWRRLVANNSREKQKLCPDALHNRDSQIKVK